MELLLLLALIPFSSYLSDSDDMADADAEDGADAKAEPSAARVSAALAAAPEAGQDQFGTTGNDTMTGGEGNDTLNGRSGDDRLFGADGDDNLLGGTGRDFASGGLGNDRALLGDGADSWGQGANRTLVDEPGSDYVKGGLGDDTLVDHLGANTLLGGDGDDWISGAVRGVADPQADRLSGGTGQDVLTGDNGDTLSGGSGADAFVVALGGKPVVITDALSEAQAGNGADLILIGTPAASMQTELHLWTRTAANGDDQEVLLGDQVVAVLRGAADQQMSIELADYFNPAQSQSSTINGTSGTDFLFGGDLGDTISAGSGNDFVHDGFGNDQVRLGTGNDEFHGAEFGSAASDNDIVWGEAGNDFIESARGADNLRGNEGDDTIRAEDHAGQTGPTADIVKGADGNDLLAGDDGDTLFGGADDDAFEIYWTPGADPVTIGDFGVSANAAESLHLFAVGHSATSFAAVVRADGTGSDLYIDGALAVRLDGVTDPMNLGEITLSDETGTQSAILTGTEGADTIGVWGNASQVAGLGGDDHIYVDDYLLPLGPYVISGGEGHDTLEGGQSDGALYGDAGNDSLWDSGADSLYGGDGADSLYLEGDTTGHNRIDGLIEGGAGNDVLGTDGAGVTLTGGAGIDHFEADYTELPMGDATGLGVIVTDFDPATETLRIETSVIQSSWTDLNLLPTADGTGTIVSLGTRQVFILQGLTPAQVPLSAITVRVLTPF